ncbi:glycosyltransferase [Asticcacaulis machinosus]|uniref:Glycosyltransferase n=1 Tax=Asticcacaulis machinosus TaxID=2984211 RepID=A0ABT5HJQ8_9CAUL|nr:glycosyltransferase [Asticcacaulis machinosus]MDC7676437.1 glycosyltransferase [Asticcacaulis machinosus]
MNILFSFGNGHFPEFSGGVQSNTDYLVKAMQARGHKGSVLCSLFGSGTFGLTARLKMKLTRRPWATDTGLGYDVRRAWKAWDAVPALVKDDRPDVAVVQCHNTVPIAAELQKQGVPLVVYFHNVEFDELGGDPRQFAGAQFISNSQFTRNRYREVFGIDSHVICPSIDVAQYETQTTGRYVTFINPVAKKGLGRAIEIATLCPEIEFLFVESWTLNPAQEAELNAAIAPLTNITFMRRTHDMRSVYGQTRILLAPSQWEETWGRVASEAHCSGIPALATHIGGLSEAVGPGGVLMPVGSAASDWAIELKRLWSDSDHYAALSQAARAYALRPEIDPVAQIDQFEAILVQASGKGNK